jgi:5'/3'-nucleotidase
MHILVTNDDGIRAPGLRALVDMAKELGTVSVVAPAHEQSAVGHSITLTTPLTVRKLRRHGEPFGWAVKGSPADCVKLAILELLDEPVDLLLSGINMGSNIGINVLYSGTVAAAIEGAYYGITSFAFSLERSASTDFAAAARICRQVLDAALANAPAKGSLFNVNVPHCNGQRPRGVRVAPQGAESYAEHFKRRVDPRGRTYYWIAGGTDFEPAEGLTDTRALAEGYVTVTPMRFTLTDPEGLERVSSWHWNLEDQ